MQEYLDAAAALERNVRRVHLHIASDARLKRDAMAARLEPTSSRTL